MKVKDILVQQGLDFIVDLGKKKVIYKPEDQEELGESNIIDNSYAVYRTDNGIVLGEVKGRYTPIQNEDAFAVIDDFIKEQDCEIVKGGCIKDGAFVYVAIRLPDSIQIGNDPEDRLEQHLIFINSHDGTKAMQVIYTPVRLFCMNALASAIDGAFEKISIRHTISSEEKLNLVSDIIKRVSERTPDIIKAYNDMIAFKVTEDEMMDIVCRLYMTKQELKIYKEHTEVPLEDIISTKKFNIIAAVVHYYHNGLGQNTINSKGTMFGVYNAITGYYNNTKYSDKPVEVKEKSVLFGEGAVKSQEIWVLCQTFMKERIIKAIREDNN